MILGETPCGVCVLHAVRRGVSFEPSEPPASLIGQEISDGTEIHPASAILVGTPVCFYHIDDVGKAAKLA